MCVTTIITSAVNVAGKAVQYCIVGNAHVISFILIPACVLVEKKSSGTGFALNPYS